MLLQTVSIYSHTYCRQNVLLISDEVKSIKTHYRYWECTGTVLQKLYDRHILIPVVCEEGTHIKNNVHHEAIKR
jgi:hypothetical protein